MTGPGQAHTGQQPSLPAVPASDAALLATAVSPLGATPLTAPTPLEPALEASPATWQRTFVTLCAAQAMAMLAFGMALPFLPLYIQSLGIDDPRDAARWAGVMSACGMVVMAIVAPIWGTLADRHGRKAMVVRALFGGGVTVAVMSLARSPGQLLALRTVQGVFSGTVSATRTLVAGVIPASQLGFALGMMQTSAFIGTSIGPLLGGVIADNLGYASAFAFTGVLLVISGCAVFLLVHEDFTPPPPAADDGHTGLRGSLRLILDVPGLAALIATLFFVQAGMNAIGPILPLFVQSLLPPGEGSVASLSGLILGATAVTSAFAAGIAGKIGDRIGHERLLAVCAVGGGLLYFPQAFVTTPWQLLGLRAVLGIFTGGLFPGVMATIALRSPASRRGWVFGVTATATALGNAAGPLVSAWTAGAFGLRAAFIVTAAALTASGIWVAFVITPRRAVPAAS